MPSARPRTRPPEPEASYSWGFLGSIELIIGSSFIVAGALVFVEIIASRSANLPSGQRSPGLDYVCLLIAIVGAIFSYFGFIRRVNWLEMSDGTLYWFLPFHRLRGQSPVADIVSVRTESTFRLGRTRTAIDLRDGRTVYVRDKPGIAAFVFTLIAGSPGIDHADWRVREPFDRSRTIGSIYTDGGD
jgi:hypothetical protein